MATTFKGSVRLTVAGTLSSGIDIGSITHNINLAQTHRYTNGDAAGKANMMYIDHKIIPADDDVVLDLSGGLDDAFGDSILFTKIKGIIVHAADTNVSPIGIGGNNFANWVNDTSDIINVRPGGTFMLMCNDADAYQVVADSGDMLEMINFDGDNQAEYDIVLIGVV